MSLNFKTIFCLSLCLVWMLTVQAQEKRLPSFEEVLSVKGTGFASISPNGQYIAYSRSKTDWKKNGYDSEIWLAKEGQEPFQLTRTTNGSSSGYMWSPDSKWLLFRANRDGSSQLYAIPIQGGEAHKIGHIDGNIGQFDWSPDGEQIAFTLTPKSGKQDKSRKERFGSYSVDDGEYKMTGLYVMDFDPNRPDPADLPCYEKTDSLKKINCIQAIEPTLLV
ncbi:MAG: S9 family peptidase, partial [Bacteroidota bacterium]